MICSTVNTVDAHLQLRHVKTGLLQRRSRRPAQLRPGLSAVRHQRCARLTVGAQHHDHITPLLADLHCVTGANIQHVSYDIRSDDCSRYASNSDKTLSHCIWVGHGVSPALRPDTRPCLHPTVRDSRPATPNSIWTLTFTRIWSLTRNLDLKLDPDLDSDLDLGSLNLWRIQFAESESEFGWDSVKPSVQCANPNPPAAISCSYRDTGVPCSVVGRVL